MADGVDLGSDFEPGTIYYLIVHDVKESHIPRAVEPPTRRVRTSARFSLS